MEKINNTLLITFDYELFLYESGHIEQCLIRPTEEILKILIKYNAQATFFVDALYLQRLKEVNMNDFYIVESQLRSIVRSGSRIELHIHPHWLDAEYRHETNDFLLDNFRYYKHSQCDDEVISKMFSESVMLLNEIARKEDANYNVVAYRAGGWCVDPFCRIKQCFIDNNLYIDSSVIPMNKCSVPHQSYDYSDIYSSEPYYFEESVHENSLSGRFIEFPITLREYTFFDRLIHKFKSLFDRTAYIRFGDGKSSLDVDSSNGKQFKLINVFKTRSVPLAIDGYCLWPSKQSISKHDVLTIVGHPKALTKTSLKVLDYLCSVSKYSVTLNEYATTEFNANRK